MERIRKLDRYQKIILVLMIFMTVIFSVVYPMTISRVGFEYKGKVLVPTYTESRTVYSGKIQGEEAIFIVTEDHAVEFRHGDKVYGPYTAKEDAAAVPQDVGMAELMTGVELREGEEILFRGGLLLEMDDIFWMYDEDGGLSNIRITYVAGDGFERDENGNIVDPMEPSASDILKLIYDPEMTHKGEGTVWFFAVFICVVNVITILFADELFRLNLALRMRNAEYAEPSELEIVGRYVSWTVLTVMALVIFVMGLR